MPRPRTTAPSPPASGRRRAPTIASAGILVAGLGFAVLAYLLYTSEGTGAVRWSLGIALLAVVSAIAWSEVSRRAREPAPLVREPPRKTLREGDLRELADAVRRAREGLEFSQVTVAQRARDAFAERVRLARGLSADRMREIQGDPKRLRALVGDPVLGDFLHLERGDRDDRYRWVRDVRGEDGFVECFEDVLERMEGWR